MTRAELIESIVTALKEITDFDDRVEDSNTQWHNDELLQSPACSVFDPSIEHFLKDGEVDNFWDKPSGTEGKTQLNVVNLRIQVFTSRGAKVEDVRALQKKVSAKMLANRYWLDEDDQPRAMWTNPVQTAINYQPAGPEGATFEISGGSQDFRIAVISDAFNF
jgi:hypothetical protein